MATAVTSLRIPTDLSERYNRLAKETGRSRSYYVNEALAQIRRNPKRSNRSGHAAPPNLAVLQVLL